MILDSAISKIIPPGVNDPPITPVGVVLHVSGGFSESLYPYFHGPSGGIESHLYVRQNGMYEQYRDTAYEADAQYHGNSFMLNGKLCGFISIETEGDCSGSWTLEQIDTILKIIRILKDVHQFPIRVCPEWNAPGIGYHSLFKQWNPNAHVCPCASRIIQFQTIIMPALLTPTPIPKDDVTLNGLTLIIDGNDAYIVGGDRNGAGKTRVHILPGGPASGGVGVYHDVIDNNKGITPFKCAVADLEKWGYTVEGKSADYNN